MNNRTATPRTAFGLIAWLEQTKIVLPLKGVECAFNVCGDVLSVEIDQIFQQNTRQPLDCLYTFPLPAGAAVYRCEMHINGRVIRARVEERERARELAQEKKAAGYRTALVEMERDNLFTLSLGNVQPDDLVVIRFAYFQTLTRLGDWTSFRIPFCPGVRYIPGMPLLRSPKGRGAIDDTDQVPDATRISPPRIDRLHPDAAYLSIEGIVEHPLNDLKDLSSPTHPLLVKPAAGSSNVSLADKGAVPDSDFIVRWTDLDIDALKPTGWVTHQQGDDYALVRLRAPVQVEAVENSSQDFYFLIDRSGSMAGIKWTKAVEAFQGFLKNLGRQDRVWASFFESHVRDFAEKPLAPAELLSDSSVKRLAALGTGGGTELLPALEHVLKKMREHSEAGPATLLLITDGQVGNEAEILKRLGVRTDLRVHVFGIDVTINDGFLQKLAAQHQGTSCLMSPHDDIVGAVARLGAQLRRPVLTSIRVDGGWETAAGGISDLHAGEVLSLAFRKRVAEASGTVAASSPASRSTTISVEGRAPDGTTRTYAIELRETAAAAISLLWCRRRIDFMLARGEHAAAIQMAKASNLVCEGAAFIAWDESERVPVSSTELYQPAIDPMDVMDVMLGSVCGAGRASSVKQKASFYRAALSEEMGGAYAQDTGQGLFKKLRSLFSREALDELTRWRGELEQNAFFQAPAAQMLLDCLVDWAKSRPREMANSVRQLDELLKAVTQASTEAHRIQLIRQWIERTMDAPFKEKALEALQHLESGIQAIQPSS